MSDLRWTNQCKCWAFTENVKQRCLLLYIDLNLEECGPGMRCQSSAAMCDLRMEPKLRHGTLVNEKLIPGDIV